MTLSASAAERRRLLSIDISWPRGAQQQTRRTPLSIDETDRQTLDRFIDLLRIISLPLRFSGNIFPKFYTPIT